MSQNPRLHYVSQSDLATTLAELRCWQRPAEFHAVLSGVLDRMPTSQLFRQAGLSFLRDAWIADEWAARFPCEAIRLCDDEWPDFEARGGQEHFLFEGTDVLEPGRRRGRNRGMLPSLRMIRLRIG